MEWSGIDPSSADQVAADLAKMQLMAQNYQAGPQTPQQTPYKPEPHKWERSPASRSPQQGRLPAHHSSFPQQLPPSFGWGGEQIPENAHNRIPCMPQAHTFYPFFVPGLAALIAGVSHRITSNTVWRLAAWPQSSRIACTRLTSSQGLGEVEVARHLSTQEVEQEAGATVVAGKLSHAYLGFFF